ncbi:short chain dehydrogenase [Moraxella caviae]|uniref:3-oxoacyl-[acyl-carrier-protein] reductase FabG n=1 Tax=Moraxella caviae TaxID=34060 RepID=A0A1T0A2Y8_9GAMM|nr:SDR family oxidoreductase [Moraxella caviae]OOR90067.1 short chain dehydrogenase [Moraxella caviae]STZ14676.1 3-oxoacyl-[acyl-carrier-protein] reductase FabG [Moraxella caviae]
MKKLEEAFAKVDKFGRKIANQFNKIKDLNKIRGIGDGKTVLITGASSGLGAAMARKFAFLGYDLAICARRLERLDALKAELEREFGVRVHTKALDVTVHDDVFTVFEAFAEECGGLDKVIVNAGVGDSRVIGHGRFNINRATAETNFIAALAQCEAAMQIFRRQNSGHLVVISSMSAVRGLPRHLTTYAAAKAGIAALAEGIRADTITEKLPIHVSTIFPGYVRTDLNIGAKYLPFEVEEDEGADVIVKAIEAKVDEAYVPAWPWLPIGLGMKYLPLRVITKFL